MLFADILSNGIMFDPKNWTQPVTAMTLPADLNTSINHLFDWLHTNQVEYLLVGGVAMLCYVEGRNTQDIDLILEANSLPNSPLEVTQQDKNFARANYENLQVDLLLTTNPLFKLVLNDYKSTWEIDDRSIPCATPDGLILLKLYALPSLYRQGQFQRANLYESDITALLIQFPELINSIDSFMSILQKHLLQSDIDALNEVINDITRRVQRSHR